jgi:serine/threonine-protein kinase
MPGDADPSAESLDSDSHEDGSAEAAFLREMAFSPAIEPPGATIVRTGDAIGRFVIEGVVGRGGMGVVYAAYDPALGRRVALKLLTGRKHGDDDEPRLLREARAAALVSHPNVATVFDIGQADGVLFIAMELVEGRTLRASLDGRKPPLSETFRIAREIARGLAAIHGAGLVHRDVKPENVMIADGGAIKILDLGLAELGDSRASSPQPLPRWAGTPGYMSPEQTHGIAVDARSDVFSLGVVLHEMFARKRPSKDATRTRGIDRRFVAIVERCLQKDPHARYADAAEVAAAIDRVTMSAGRPLWGVTMAAIAALLVLGAWVTWHGLRPTSPPLDSNAPTTAPRAGSMLALALPASSSAAALVAYKTAMQSFHDSNWGQAELSLREALGHDPALGVAHLRLALIMSYLDYTAPEAKASYREAARLRSSLSPRDHDLLVALEPLLNTDPVDLGETVRRLRASTVRHPVDAELFQLLGIYARWEDPDRQLEAARQAIAIDPDYADAWAAVAEASMDRDTAASIAALERCLDIAPTAADCRMMRATLESALGRCEEAERHIRQATDDPHASEYMFLLRARFLYALGQPRDAVADALRQRWARLQPGAAEEESLYDGAVLAAAYGDFDAAKNKAEEGLRLVDTQATLRAHARFVLLLTDVELEAGRTKAAAAVASSFLARKSAWQRGLVTEDPTVYLTRVAAHDGRLSLRDARARQKEWFESATGSTGEQRIRQTLWRLAYLEGIERRGDAEEALAIRPAAHQGSVLDDALDGSLGRALSLAGRRDEAIAYLARAHRRCDRLVSVVSAMRSDLVYGEALEKGGDRAGACDAYRSILARWGEAKPRSATADAARRRSVALGCPAK